MKTATIPTAISDQINRRILAISEDKLQDFQRDPLGEVVFWGGRSEIKPSEISPFAYRDWCQSVGLDADGMME